MTCLTLEADQAEGSSAVCAEMVTSRLAFLNESLVDR